VAESAADPQNLIWVMPAEEGVSNEVVVVVAGGEAPRPETALTVPLGATVVAADRGLEHALALGLEVALVVGDFDSASPEAVAEAEAAGTRVVRHPADKDATDLELALVEALALAPARIVVLAGGGGRLDHLLSLLLALGSHRFEKVQLDAAVGDAQVHVVRGGRTIAGTTGELVSLLALHGPAEAVWTEGLVYELRGETLEPGSSRGVSNVFAADTARVTLERGVLLAIRPGPEGERAK
jgi:thiamine pyrophosphokinase